eukprot:TRINITY_DN3632_c0_g1_i4.p1 TRINITY_DN3632_c0_g1~~TRINITY_DN3632_c0_g1_i4.p1  ORF type:complete len:261 (-),score=43.64 TRINITY_DN3632_c0_g1_i4:701-1483(-)
MPLAVKMMEHDVEKKKLNNFGEIGFLSSCNHPNIVKFMNAYENSKKVEECWLVMEYMQGGTLRDAIKFHNFSSDHMRHISLEILKGINYIHSLGWVHRDLKTSNVMLTIEGNVKIVDFGLCTDVSNEEAMRRIAGSPYWMAPELFLRTSVNQLCDIWSWGVIVLEMLLGVPPYYPRVLQACFIASTVGLLHLIPEGTPPDCCLVLSKALEMDMNQRLGSDELLLMEWFSQECDLTGLKEVIRSIFYATKITNVMEMGLAI